jgi:outer membrane protein
MSSRAVAVLAVLALVAGVVPSRAQDPGATPLTLQQAEQIALQNHPLIQAAQYGADAARQAVRETRAPYFPTAFGSVTGAEAESGSRIAAGGLNNPIIFNRFSTGVTIGQLLTDFGRTHALVQSSSLNAQAQEAGVDGRRADVLFGVDRAYFNVLRAQAVQRVAQDTVNARQLVVDQVSALAASGLKSSLDVSFARVNLSEAQLLLAQAEGDVRGSLADLSTALGGSQPANYTLAEEPLPPALPPDSAPLVAEALRDRPDVAAERFIAQAASKLADAERDLFLPSVAAVGTFGATPYHQAGIEDRYAAVGVNVNVPLSNGGLFAARHAEALFKAKAENQRERDVENRVSRDVQLAWLNARTAFQRLGLTDQLFDQATQALDLAQQRYSLGLSSIVELSQAQLNKTQAELAQASAKYEYQAERAALEYQIGARR